MSIPILYGSPWWWESDSDPTENVPTDKLGYISYGNTWRNTTTNALFLCINGGDNQNNGLEWLYMYTLNTNVLDELIAAGWKINTSRSYSLRSSPAFNTSYKPSSTNDTMVSVVVILTSTIITAGTVNFQIDTGSGFTTVGESSISGLAAINAQAISCLFLLTLITN